MSSNVWFMYAPIASPLRLANTPKSTESLLGTIFTLLRCNVDCSIFVVFVYTSGNFPENGRELASTMHSNLLQCFRRLCVCSVAHDQNKASPTMIRPSFARVNPTFNLLSSVRMPTACLSLLRTNDNVITLSSLPWKESTFPRIVSGGT